MLRLVSRENKQELTHFQTDLFPNSDPRSILLVSLPLKSGKDFLQVVERTSPRLVVDLRDIPRFDFDILSRGKVFELFAKVRSVYVDIEAKSKTQGREDRWADLFVEQRALAETKKGNPSGPYMFLFSDYEQLLPFEQFLRRELPQLNPSPWSIFYVASQEEFAVHRFTR
jgi:hypothetical protein